MDDGDAWRVEGVHSSDEELEDAELEYSSSGLDIRLGDVKITRGLARCGSGDCLW